MRLTTPLYRTGRVAAAAMLLLVAAGAPTVRAAAPAGFEAIFNGVDTTGWQGRAQIDPVKHNSLTDAERAERQTAADASFAAHWKVEEGQLINDGEGVFATTAEDYGDFELLLDWKIAPTTDSGVYLRGCPQVQIWNPDDPAKAKHDGALGSGGLWNNNPGAPGKNPLVRADRPVGEWNTFRIRMLGERVSVWLNDRLVVDDAVMHNYFDREAGLPESGPIQLQTHGAEVRFRNVYLKRLDGRK
ncbi:hypothetical protein Mal64_27920 [Pseudobythopirellula maris]|uniref:3-keto-alpha-glucoside-1,2-lyase/3-keto-2-hydroxy-glucal hydratase domain-containing protein n=1 Tax=Pseudobythopirellula maris TaxID=2527991 RepID=A0A5C5ZIR6_9BACT|nr:DUF1080 domain-containing protein [Pseudobythopirellula maris]TWT87254.1 hypothetical protein Mal64_27920 [Pseudobythopirellula maris]